MKFPNLSCLTADQLMDAARRGSVLSPKDWARISPSQLVELVGMGLVLTNESMKLLTDAQRTELIPLEIKPFRDMYPRLCTAGVCSEIVGRINSSADFHNWDNDAVVIRMAANLPRFNGADVEVVLEKVSKNSTDARTTIRQLLKKGILKQKVKNGRYVLFMDRKMKQQHDEKYQQFLSGESADKEPEKAEVSQSLKELAQQINDPAQKVFLEETLRCLKAEAYRAAIVMSWNLTYDHLLRWLIKDKNRLNEFNAKLTKRFWRKGTLYEAVANRVDFERVKESVVLDECIKAGLVRDGKDQLREGLKKRNRYAHPSRDIATAPIAAGHIDDLLQHVVLSQEYKC